MEIKSRTSGLAVLALMKNEKGQILGVSRKFDRNDFGLPGGKVDEGETAEEAMVREVKEETGLDVIEYEPLYFREALKYGTMVLVFNVTKFTGEINETEEGAVEWVEWDDVNKGTYGKFNKDLEDFINRRNLQEHI